MARRLTQSGPLWVVLAALLWATDALVRVRSVQSMDPTLVVFCEHLVIVTLLLPALLVRKWRKEAFVLSGSEMLLAALVGTGGSALATLFFTASFQLLNPSVSILIQKLQPILVVVLARIFLGERPTRNFYAWALLALVAATVLSWPDQNVDSKTLSLEIRGTLYSLGAAAAWALSTIAGRKLLLRRPVFTINFWRFVWGLIALAVILAFMRNPLETTVEIAGTTTDLPLFFAILYMGIGPGLLAMAAYYRGLATTPASYVTFLELIFPVCAVALNAIFLDARFTPIQWVSGAVLLAAVSRIHKSAIGRPA